MTYFVFLFPLHDKNIIKKYLFLLFSDDVKNVCLCVNQHNHIYNFSVEVTQPKKRYAYFFLISGHFLLF